MAAASPLALTFFYYCILLLEIICCAGAFVDLSYDSTQVKIQSSSVFSEYKVVVTEKQHAYLFMKPFECRAKSCRSEHLAGSFVNEVLDPNRHLNISNIIVMATERQLGALRRTLRSVHSSLGPAGLAESVTVSPELSLSSLRIMAKDRAHRKQWGEVMEFVRWSGSFVQVEIEAESNSELAVAAQIQEAFALTAADAGVVIHLKTRVAPSAAGMANLVGDASREERFLGLLVDTQSPRRELTEAARATAHDEFSPVTNPATTPVTNPVTVPSTNPVTSPMSPGFVTVPSTNPGSGFATNPNLPPLYPEPTSTPVTMPDPTTTPAPFANPVAAPTTMPGSVTNPVTNPATTPVTNPATTYPYPQQGAGAGGMPVYQPPATMPGGTVQPAAPTMAGQAWCVAKTGLTDLALQDGIDYACGIGGADCSAIQPMGACYNPNTMQAHASYAFNSYYQRNPSPTSCDFGGAGMLVNVNPSSGTCMYQTSAGSSSFGAGYTPGATGTVPTGYTPGMSGSMGGGSGSTVLNANNPVTNSMYGGSDNPTGLTAGAASLSCGWVLCLIWMVTFAFVKEKA
ncbi:hypothetical protein U9M48_011057 [Paspalum notatum var. saurae]|uniref:X8 domain-containing protein n=1 Tax=Paspalum notatum var. saurae TaxID=547442 RepID=A0AAQ3SUF6_PASNO